MVADELRRRSRWMIRALEWDDPRARYPNIWHEGMPRHIQAFDTVAGRLRLGDLIAVYHPASKRHPERANRFLGISHVVGLRKTERTGYSWVDVETAHRFASPLDLGQAPRRVFLCCDVEWPEHDVSLFQKVFDAAVAEGWQPGEDETAGRVETGPSATVEEEGRPSPEAGAKTEETSEGPAETDRPEAEGSPAALAPEPGVRLFGGVDYSGDMRDPRDATWLALVELREDKLRVIRLEAAGRHGLQAHLRDPDTVLMHVEAIGLDFPFGLPLPFAERLLDGPFPEEGWWALARRLEKVSRPDFLVAMQEFRDAEGELKRLTDEQADAFSPLHRVNPDLGPMTYHGIRMIAEERSRYAVRPFESAQGKLLLEVYPGAMVRRLKLKANGGKRERQSAIVDALAALDYLPVIIEEPHLRWCRSKRDALDAVIAARCAAAAVISGETEKTAEKLVPEHGKRVRLEGWIYGLAPEAEPGT